MLAWTCLARLPGDSCAHTGGVRALDVLSETTSQRKPPQKPPACIIVKLPEVWRAEKKPRRRRGPLNSTGVAGTSSVANRRLEPVTEHEPVHVFEMGYVSPSIVSVPDCAARRMVTVAPEVVLMEQTSFEAL